MLKKWKIIALNVKDVEDLEEYNQSTSKNESEEIESKETEPEYLTYEKVVKGQSNEAEQYHDITVKVEWTNKLYSLILVGLLLIVGYPNYLAKISPFTRSYSLLSIGFVFITFFTTIYLLGLPFSIYSEKIERDFEFSTKSNKKFVTDQLKGFGIGLIILLLIIEGIFAAIHFQPGIWWVYAFIGYFIFAGVIQTLSPWLMSLFTNIESLEDVEVRDTVERLADEMKLEYKDIYRWDLSDQTTKANAAVTGFGSSLRIILGDTLINNFRNDEIEVVMAHEIGHQQNSDIYRGMLFTGLISLIAFIFVDFGFDLALATFDLRGMDDPASIGYFLFAMMFALELLSSLQLWYTRRREKAADFVSLNQIQDVQIFESAFARLSKQNLDYPNPSKLEVILRYSHPPIRDRVKYAKEFVKEN